MQNAQERPKYDNEISLVELAVTFIRRRRIFSVTVILVTLLGLAYAFIQPEKYEYVTLLESAERADGEFIEKPSATVAAIENRWVPEVISNYQDRNNEKLPFKIKSSNPENTGLIHIVSEASEDNAGLVQRIHQSIADNVIDRQRGLFKAQETSLKNQISSIEKVIESLNSKEGGENFGSALAAAIQKRSELEGSLAALRQAQSLVIGRQSVEQSGVGSLLIILLSAFLGAAMGVFLVFLAEFSLQVRKSLRQDDAA